MPFLVEQDLHAAIFRYNTVIEELRQMSDLLFDNLSSNPRSIEWAIFKGEIILEELGQILEISPVLQEICINSQELSLLIGYYETVVHASKSHLQIGMEYFDPYECKHRLTVVHNFKTDLHFLVVDDLETAVSRQTRRLESIESLNSGQFLNSGFLKAHVKYSEKGYEVHKSCIDFIFQQTKDLIREDQKVLNEYADSVRMIVAVTEKTGLSNDFDPYKGTFSSLFAFVISCPIY
jgi:hypothetical protein